MYSTKTGLILGFQGCDAELCKKVVAGERQLIGSENEYDWLGHGIYFWENNPERAYEYACFLAAHPRNRPSKIKEPAVIGATIDLGYCLDLMENKSLLFLKEAYTTLRNSLLYQGFELPVNKPVDYQKDLLLRYLDCAVIESFHDRRHLEKVKPFDSVRAVFFEGDDLYPNAGFKEKNHIQVCIRNPNCIKGYFLPRKKHRDYVIP